MYSCTVLLNLLSIASAYLKIHRNYLCKGWLKDYCFLCCWTRATKEKMARCSHERLCWHEPDCARCDPSRPRQRRLETIHSQAAIACPCRSIAKALMMIMMMMMMHPIAVHKWLRVAVRRICHTTLDRTRNLSTPWLLVVWTTTPNGFNDHSKYLPLHVRYSEKSAPFCDWYTHTFASDVFP